MMGFLGKLFGTDKAIEKGIDVVSNGLDKLIYTDEEKADDGRKERSEARSMIIEWMQATQGQNLARRMIALVVTCTWLTMYLASTVLNLTAIWVDAKSDEIIQSAELIGDRATEMGGAMMLILGFYFAAPHIGNLIGPAIKKFSGDKPEGGK